MTFECLRLMMKAVDEVRRDELVPLREAVNSANHRSVLKSLGSWLGLRVMLGLFMAGLITIGRDQPLKSWGLGSDLAAKPEAKAWTSRTCCLMPMRTAA